MQEHCAKNWKLNGYINNRREDYMGRLGFGEILMVLFIVLLLFGPKKLPELARSMGEAVREFRKGQKEIEDSINEPLKADASETKTAETADTANAAESNATTENTDDKNNA